MIDVLLTILIFFMTITSAQVLKVDKSITLPLAPDALKKDNARAETVVNVRWKPDTRQAEFVVDDRVFNLKDLADTLRAAKAAGEKKITAGTNPTFRAVIRGDRELPAVQVSRAMNACAEAGISDIAFSSVNKD